MKKVLSKHFIFRLATLYIHVLIHEVKLQKNDILYSNFFRHIYIYDIDMYRFLEKYQITKNNIFSFK